MKISSSTRRIAALSAPYMGASYKISMLVHSTSATIRYKDDRMTHEENIAQVSPARDTAYSLLFGNHGSVILSRLNLHLPLGNARVLNGNVESKSSGSWPFGREVGLLARIRGLSWKDEELR